MADIELVIKMDEEDYERLKEYKKAPFCSLTSRTYEAIANGVLLPKGHGRLIDADRVDEAIYKKFDGIQCYDGTGYDIYSDVKHCIDDIPPTIEVDKEQE